MAATSTFFPLGTESWASPTLGSQFTDRPVSPLTEEGAVDLSSTREPFIIGVAGGSASGKTTVCQRIIESIGEARVVLISQDWFYKGLTPDEIVNVASYNFDHPNAFDLDFTLEMLQRFKTAPSGSQIDVPIYDYVRHCRSEETRTVNAGDVIIFEGIFAFYHPQLLRQMHIKIFVDSDDDVRLCRRIRRDIVERGRDVSSVLKQYEKFVKPAFDEFIYPTKKWADIIIPRGADNLPALDLISQHIRSKLECEDITKNFPQVKVLPSTFQVKSLHTIVRDASCPRADFVFYADRLIRLLVEFGLGFVPFFDKTVTTPTGAPYVGLGFEKSICGVSIIRAGESMENALRAVCKNIRVGKILIQKDAHGHRKLQYGKLPKDITTRHVLLLDPVLASGRTVCCAIKFLKSKGVHEKNILCLTLIASPQGLRHVCNKFPEVRVISSELDIKLDERGMTYPGIGIFGDRYFGTEDEEYQVLRDDLA